VDLFVQLHITPTANSLQRNEKAEWDSSGTYPRVREGDQRTPDELKTIKQSAMDTWS
jgi:hypothetical protein